ncbi:MAG TPA: alpha-glucan family phosphorylase, partial [Myxococcota bacterium]|nr:alpha-glucan family phosphorylase [Myxococcota bacterium]
QTVEERRLEDVASDQTFRQRFALAARAYRENLEAPGWFQRNHSSSPLTGVGYLSMEFGLSDALPIYSGGLGNVAGDQLKSASDLAVPVVGVGLLYQCGYFRQEVDAQGNQREFYPYNDPVQLPVLPVRDGDGGEWLRLVLDLPGRRLWLRTWVVRVGRVRLYLLDSNDPMNTPADRGITGELYGGGSDTRLLQEIALGIGGWRLLGRLGLRPEVCHLNEGHAAFAVIERAAEFMRENQVGFEVALAVTRAGNIFTTHTPVAAGFDRFAPDLVAHHMARYADRIGIGIHGLLTLGRLRPEDETEPLNMAYLAMRGAGAVNGVSRLHGAVSREILSPLFPRVPIAEVPVSHVTNGVHPVSWVSSRALELWRSACGDDVWTNPSGTCFDALAGLPDEELWGLRSENRRELVHYARARLALTLAARGEASDAIAAAAHAFDPNVLTIGFARRFATYKRPNLLLSDRLRLQRILCHAQRPVQLVIAGKAHPRDEPGKAMLREWVHFLQDPAVRLRAMFIPDYDITLAQHLVQGVDVWINTPRRPWEASGTSGMKILANGGLNLSELDGWWAEAYESGVGWAIGDGRAHGEDPAWDAAEADALYTLLEKVVAPCFYERDERGIPRRWVAHIRASMSQLVPCFSTSRTVREYTEELYIPAAFAYRERAADGGKLGARIVAECRQLREHWSSLHFGSVLVDSHDDRHFFRVQVYLGDLDRELVRVELYAEDAGGAQGEAYRMERAEAMPGAANAYIFSAQVPASRAPGDYTARAVPAPTGARIPLELPLIHWQR